MSWNDIKNEMLQDKGVQEEYAALQPEYEVVRTILEARKSNNMTQQQLADKTGINRADISKLESGNSNPSIHLLQRLANGMNMTLKLEFVPKEPLEK